MPQTPPAHFMMPRKLTDTELAQAIRLDLESELDAFNLYESHINATDNELAKKVLEHIRDEEREHASLFWALLKHLDPQIIEEDAEAPAKLKLIGEGKSEAEIEAILEKKSPAPTEPPSPDGASTIETVFTVGSLRRQRQS